MPGNPAHHFGKQLRKERLARGWSLDDLAAQMKTAAAHLSRIENGKRPPTERIAGQADEVFPGRRGWFTEFYRESRDWTPAGFRSWGEYEDRAARLSLWSPGIVHGLVQVQDYARAMLAVNPGATDEMVSMRLQARMERQRRILGRDDPPVMWIIVDQLSLYREVGSAEVMAAQCGRLIEVAGLPHVTLTVMPAVTHPANEAELIITEEAAYTEHAVSGGVYTEEQIISALAARFDSLRAESYRASESMAMIERLAGIWSTGASPATAALTAGPA